MTAPGLRSTERFLHGEAPLPGFVARFLTRNKLVVHDRPVLGPNPAGRTKVRSAALGRDASAGERNNFSSRGDHVAEPLNSTGKIFGDHQIVPIVSGQAEGCHYSA